jgi:tetratricopeptide (TPR) repeat protein
MPQTNPVNKNAAPAVEPQAASPILAVAPDRRPAIPKPDAKSHAKKSAGRAAAQAGANAPAAGAAKRDRAIDKTAKKTKLMQSAYWLAIVAFVGAGCYLLASKKDIRLETIKVTEESFSEADMQPDFDLPPPDVKTPEPAPAPVPEPEQKPAPDAAAAAQPAAPPASVGASDQFAVEGQQKLLAGDYVGALEEFTRAIEARPTAFGYIFRGEVLLNGANYDAAIADFNAAIQMNPDSVIAYYDRALVNIKLEKLTEARSDLSMALSAFARTSDSPIISSHDIYAKRAQVNLWLRNWSEADADYTAAITQTDGDLDYEDYTGRAEARTGGGDYQGAVADYVAGVTIISDRIQKTPDEARRENMSRQAMGFFEKSGALRVKLGEMELARQDLQAAHTLAIALGDSENKSRLEILIASIQ